MSAGIFYGKTLINVTPHATENNSYDCLYIGTGGDVVIIDRSSNANQVTFKNLISGQFLPVRTSIIPAIGTTATDIIGIILG